MFGPQQKSSSTIDDKASVLALLQDDRLTPAQKSAYCFDQGLCDVCGVKTHWIGPFKRRPYTNEKVFQGICRTCHPERVAAEAFATRQQQNQQQQNQQGMAAMSSWTSQIQKQLVVPPDVLLAKTTTAFTNVQSSVTKGINNLNDNIKQANDSGAIQEQQQKMVAGTNRALSSLQSGLTVGVHHVTAGANQMKDSLDRATEKGEQFMLNQHNNHQKQQQQKQQQKRQPAFSGLKTNFQTQEQSAGELMLLEHNEPSQDNNDNANNNNGSRSPASSSEPPPTLEGRVVSTPFGKGQVVRYRPEDDIYVIELHQSNQQQSGVAAMKSNTKLFCKKESFSVEDQNQNRQKQSMAINEAYESLEKMRRLNLELECQERGVHNVDFEQCTTCLLHPQTDPKHRQRHNFPRIRRLLQDQTKKRNAATPCLFCAAPSCPAHSSSTFRKEGITACQDCVKLFEPDYIVDCVNHAHSLHNHAADMDPPKTREQQVDHMIDLYDRVLLLLQYSSQYIESIAAALEENTEKANTRNVGASSAGIVSGALGVAAAAAIFTPAGPPLLVASLLLGGGATAVQTGTEAINYFSEPNKFADKIIALIGMVHSLLRVKETLREILTARLLEEQGNPEIDRLKKSLVHLREKQRSAALKAGTTVASTAVLGGVAIGAVEVAASAATVESAALMTSLEAGTLAGRNANMLSKSGTAIARGARFARFAGGALSVATLALEAKTLSSTIQQIKAGNPCEKADALRTIMKELPLVPTTEQLDDECRIYMGAMSNRVNATSLEDAINLIESQAMQEWQVTKAKVQEVEGENDSHMAETGASILGGEDDGNANENCADDLTLLQSSLKMAQAQRLAQSMSELPSPDTMAAQNGHSATADSAIPAGRMAQSMTQLPSAPSVTQGKQSALLERIQKFKQDESFCSTTSTDNESSGAQPMDQL